MSRKESTLAEGGIKIISENRKARFNYHIIDTFEAGMVLTGAEIKAIRKTGISLEEAYVRPEGNALYLLGAHITPYAFSLDPLYNPVRARKLLLHKREINKLNAEVKQAGLTIVPLKLYLKRGYAKLLIGLAKGKNAPDKRDTIKRREGDREAARAVRERSK